LAVVLKGYYDGSGKPDDRNATHLTLAGFVGTFAAWERLEQAWTSVLKDHRIRYLHMSEAWSFTGEYSGWTTERLQRLLVDIQNRCFAKIGWEDFAFQFNGVACTINLTDWRRVKEEYPGCLPGRAEALCVNQVIHYSLMGIPLTEAQQRTGTMELFFDKGEHFLHEVNRLWRVKPSRRLKPPLNLIVAVVPVDMESSPAIQAADYLAWNTNRSFQDGSNPLRHRFNAKHGRAAEKLVWRL
jgi:hypothetical protein